MATKFGRTFAALKGRKFGDKKFRFLTTEDTKREADRRANQERSRGKNARVTRERSELGKIFYIVWIR